MKLGTKKNDINVEKNKRKGIINEETPFIITEAYKMARTNLIFSLSTSSKKIITFTSFNPSEGKSSTSVNMAITLASTGSKVLLIDCDLRKPTIHKLLKLPNKNGISSIISSQCTINEARNLNVRDNLDVITCGPIPPNPSELLSSEQMKTALELLQEKYDYICLDTPPIGVVSDALLLNPLSSGIIFVIRENATTHSNLISAIEKVKLTNGKLLGIMKVACSVDGKGGSSYKYKYKYSYEYKEKKTETKVESTKE